MQPVTITINQQEVSGRPGLTVLELARESGITIPTLCHHASLSPIGACRICIVENEANGALLASCVTPIAPGMIINTESPRVLEHRRMILKLMLASHPDACLVCDKGNRCELRRLAAEMGLGLIELDRIPQPALTEELNPFLIRDMSKCILCARCIRACQELVVEGALDYFGRGFKARPATLFQAPLENSECTFCGVCVALCPTGALMEKEPLYRGTVGASVESTCPYCGCGCSISLEIKENRVARVVPGNELPGPETLCVRGSYGCDFIHSPERLTRPLIREEGGFREASWEEALAVTAAALGEIKAVHGAESLAVFGSANCTNEENYLLQRFARTVLGTNNIDNGSSLYYAAARRALYDALGFPGIAYPLRDLARSDLIMVIGADPETSAPLAGYEIKRAVKMKGAGLILIDPRKTKLSLFAGCVLQPRVGTDLELLRGMAKVIIEEKLTDREFIARKTEKYQDLLASLSDFSLEAAAESAGVSAEQIRRAALLYASAGQAAIIYGTGIMQQSLGVENIKALLNLALLTGHIWRKGGGLRALLRECNALGACDMGALPDFLPGHQHVGELPAQKKFERCWQTALPAAPGFDALEMMEQARRGKIKGMLIAGENPAASFPGASQIQAALGALDFLVVQDIFLTETARQAHVVLPAVSFAEKEGAFTNMEGNVKKIRRAVDPAGESRPDWKIILQLAEAMERPLPFGTLEQVQKELEEMVPFYKYDGESIIPEEEDILEARAGHRLPLKKFPGFSRLDNSPRPPASPPPPPEEGVFTLLAESTLFRWGSGSRSSKSRRLSRFSPLSFLKMNRAEAEKMELHAGDPVEVISAAGRLKAVLMYSDDLPPGIVTLPRSGPGAPAAALFSSSPEQPAPASALDRCYVRIERSCHHEP